MNYPYYFCKSRDILFTQSTIKCFNALLLKTDIMVGTHRIIFTLDIRLWVQISIQLYLNSTNHDYYSAEKPVSVFFL